MKVEVERKLPLHEQTILAIRESMQVTQDNLIDLATYHPNFFIQIDPSADSDVFLQEATFNRGVQGAKAPLSYMLSKHPDLVDKSCVVIGTGSFKDKSWEQHWCFLIKDKEGFYHMGSAANHDPSAFESRMTQLVSSSNIDEVLLKMKNQEGGDWPSGDFLEQLMQQGEIKDKKELTCSTALWTENGVQNAAPIILYPVMEDEIVISPDYDDDLDGFSYKKQNGIWEMGNKITIPRPEIIWEITT